MVTSRNVLLAASVCLAAGVAVTAHNLYIEASGVSERVSFARDASQDVEFRPHWPRRHFVSLLLDEGPAGPCVDSQGFPREAVDLQWELWQGRRILASGAAADSRLRIGREGDRTIVLGAFEVSPRHVYTLRLQTRTGCTGLDVLSPRVEVGLRPGRPLLAYSLTGHAFLLLGAGLLFGFTRRADKSWPYLPLYRWITRR